MALEGDCGHVLRGLRQPLLEHPPRMDATTFAPYHERDAVGGHGHPRPPGAAARIPRGIDVQAAGHGGEHGRIALLARDHHVVSAAARRAERDVRDAIDGEVDRRVGTLRGEQLRRCERLVGGRPHDRVHRPGGDEGDHEAPAVGGRDDRLGAGGGHGGIELLGRLPGAGGKSGCEDPIALDIDEATRAVAGDIETTQALDVAGGPSMASPPKNAPGSGAALAAAGTSSRPARAAEVANRRRRIGSVEAPVWWTVVPRARGAPARRRGCGCCNPAEDGKVTA